MSNEFELCQAELGGGAEVVIGSRINILKPVTSASAINHSSKAVQAPLLAPLIGRDGSEEGVGTYCSAPLAGDINVGAINSADACCAITAGRARLG